MKGNSFLALTILLLIVLSFCGCFDSEKDPNGNDDNDTPTNQQFSANFTVSPSPFVVNKTLFFNDSSIHPGSSIMNWTWQLGDGTVLYGASIIHQYNASAFYDVNLTIQDSTGKKDSIVKRIFIYEIPLLNRLSLTVSDLPDGYARFLESYNSSIGFNVTEPFYELYNEQFIYQDLQNKSGYPLITTTMIRFVTDEDAEQVLINSSQQIIQIASENWNLVSDQISDSIGNQSVYRLYEVNLTEEYEYDNASWSFIYFRVQNISVYIDLKEIPTTTVNYQDLTYQYASLIEQRIQSYFAD